MNAHVHQGSGWWGGVTTLKNGELIELDKFYEQLWTERQKGEKQKSAVIVVAITALDLYQLQFS